MSNESQEVWLESQLLLFFSDCQLNTLFKFLEVWLVTPPGCYLYYMNLEQICLAHDFLSCQCWWLISFRQMFYLIHYLPISCELTTPCYMKWYCEGYYWNCRQWWQFLLFKTGFIEWSFNDSWNIWHILSNMLLLILLLCSEELLTCCSGYLSGGQSPAPPKIRVAEHHQFTLEVLNYTGQNTFVLVHLQAHVKDLVSDINIYLLHLVKLPKICFAKWQIYTQITSQLINNPIHKLFIFALCLVTVTA